MRLATLFMLPASHCAPDLPACWPLSADRSERDTAQSRHSARNRPLLTSTYGHAADMQSHGEVCA